MNINSTLPDDRCENCGDEFANHNYVANSIDVYTCPHPQYETGYGYRKEANPYDFSPDYESCSEKELANHEKALDEWDAAITEGREPVIVEGSFGVGLYSIEIETKFLLLERYDQYTGDLFDD